MADESAAERMERRRTTRADGLTSEALARDFAAAFDRLRELDRVDPAGAAHLRATIAAEVRGWYARDAVPLVAEGGRTP